MKCSGDEKSLKPNYKVKRSGSVKTSGGVITSQRKRCLVVSRPVIREPQGDDGPMLEASRQRLPVRDLLPCGSVAPCASASDRLRQVAKSSYKRQCGFDLSDTRFTVADMRFKSDNLPGGHPTANVCIRGVLRGPIRGKTGRERHANGRARLMPSRVTITSRETSLAISTLNS